MAYGLKEFCDDCREEIDVENDTKNLEAIRVKLEQLVQNEDFVNEHCGPDAATGTHTLYHDPEKDFMVLAHINNQGRTSPPHDHGASWAIYCQAVKFTEMTDYERRDDQSTEGHAVVEETRKYKLEPGMAGYFDSHQIHSIHFPDGARFIRVTGTDLTKLKTKRYDQTKQTVTVIDPNATGDVAGAATA